MKIIPHSYQVEAVASIFNYFGQNTGNPLLALPTGTGKSVVIAEFLNQVYSQYPFTKVLVLTHVKELVQQNHAKLINLWEQAPAGINSAGLKQRDVHHPIIFAGIGSVAKKPHQFGKVDLVIIDECHLVSDKETTTYRKFLNDLLTINPNLKVIGFTATPWRAGVGYLTDNGLFTDICFDITTPHAFRRLIVEGFLSPLIPRRMENYLDVNGVHMQNGDFNLSELQNAVDREEITLAALREAIQYGGDRKKWLIFASGVEHSIHIAEMLTHLGIRCEAVHSKISNNERDRILNEFKYGDLQAVSNNNVLTTGFDNPNIDLIVMLRPTMSVTLWVQMMGRGTRVVYASGYNISTLQGRLDAINAGGKQNCLVLDFAGNTQRLGPINEPRIPRKKGEKGGNAPVKACPGCNIYIHISATECEHCGHQFTFQTKIKARSSNQELISGDLPVVEQYEVDRITYNLHNGRNGKPDSIKVTYYCGYTTYNEYVCIHHPEGSFPLRKAREWWKKRVQGIPLPTEDDRFFTQTTLLHAPTHIRVWVNKQYPEIMAYCFDGTNFGQQESSEKAPEVEEKQWVEYDDEIPF